MNPQNYPFTSDLTGRISPLIAVPFSGDVTIGQLQAAHDAGARIAELRVDLFANHSLDHVVETIRRARSIFANVLVTVRSNAEGGNWTRPDSERLALYNAAITEGAWVDIQLSSLAIRDHVVKAACGAQNPVPVILSFHDFAKTPDLQSLNHKISEAEKLGATLAKIATTTTTLADVQILAALLAKKRAIPLVVIGMGALGALSRIFFPALGSPFTFAHHGNPTAPGQLSIEETVALLQRFYPDFQPHPTWKPKA